MTRIAGALALSLLLLACSKSPEPVASPAKPAAAPAAAAPTAVSWVKPEGANIAAVFTQAKAANKPVFLYWGAVCCPPCNQIKATVFTRADFIARSQSFVPVYLDGDTAGAQKLGAQFKVRGYPTMILFRPDGGEITRLPGEVDAARYMELLNLGLASTGSVKESLAAALAGAAITPDAWRMLSYYAWDQDEAQLVAASERAATLGKLAQACPTEQSASASRLALWSIVALAQDKTAQPNARAGRERVLQILNDAAQARVNFDLLVNDGADLVQSLSSPASAERRGLLAAMNAALDRLAADASLSTSDRLSAVSARVALVQLDLPKGALPKLGLVQLAQVRAAVAEADKVTTSAYERQSVIPGAADLLSQAGLLDESDALLKAELPKAISPYYHMLVLAANAKTRGNKAAALDWTQKAWEQSVGPATRLQWGGVYVSRLIELTPQDAARIEKAVATVLGEIEPVPEYFYERNRRGLEKMGQKLLAWNAHHRHDAALKKLSMQIDAVCAKLPPQDDARAACFGIFNARSGTQKV